MEEKTKTNGSNGTLKSVLWNTVKLIAAAGFFYAAFDDTQTHKSRKLQEISKVPSYMAKLMEDLKGRKKLFEETPPEEIKYWFEYTGPLQKYFYRFSKSRGKADYFEGRDDSGVVSTRFVEHPGGTEEYQEFFLENHSSDEPMYHRLLENCLAMGSANRPSTGSGSTWNTFYGKSDDRCRVLIAMNMVGASKGTEMLWETMPPLANAEGPTPFIGEQETSATHLQRNLQEIDAMCESGIIAARVQVLVCEPIPTQWVEWMDAQVPHCGGKRWPLDKKLSDKVKLENRPSPIQVVVTASRETAEECHNLKSGFMETRVHDLLLAPSYLGSTGKGSGAKTTHPDLVSSEDHDVYIGMKWSSLVTIRSLHAFLQASADLAAAAASSTSHDLNKDASPKDKVPSSEFLIPSFVRVSYVSEENAKVAKWRMHGDFFHPAAWEVCKDSFETTWIPHSLAGSNLAPICDNVSVSATSRKLGKGSDCGQWWIFFTELQMPTSPEIYADEVSPAPVAGGSNYFWMITEAQRQQMAKVLQCRHDEEENCPSEPQAVIPLGDLESFLINYTPNTALGRKHVKHRRPGYTNEEEFEKNRQMVQAKKLLKDDEDIESALFDYTIYPAALFHKDATIKAVRGRDHVLSGSDHESHTPQKIKSSYYDITITKPRPPILGWCQMIARRGLCTLYADYFRTSSDDRCSEACGLKHDFTSL